VNPYQMQRRIVKATKLADMAENLGFDAEEFRGESTPAAWARACEIKEPSVTTWALAADLLQLRNDYDGPGGMDHPRFVQRMAVMAVGIADTLAKHDLDSEESDYLTKGEKRAVARLSEADQGDATFDLGRWFLKLREEFRWRAI
jgi:hypothetical protein